VLALSGVAAVLLQDREHRFHALQPDIDIDVAAGVVPRFGKRCTGMTLNNPRQGGLGLQGG